MSFQLLERKLISNIDDLIGGNVLIQRSPTIVSLLKRIKDAGDKEEERFIKILEKNTISVTTEGYTDDVWFDTDLGQYLVCNYDIILDKLGLLKPDEPLFDLIKAVKMAEEKYQSLCNLRQRVNGPFSYKFSGSCGDWMYLYNEDDEEYDIRVVYKGTIILGIDYPHVRYVSPKLTESYQGRIGGIIEDVFDWGDPLVHPLFFNPLEHDKGVEWCLDD